MSFYVREGQQIELYYGDTETEAVKIAVDSLERDLKKVFQEVTILRKEISEIKSIAEERETRAKEVSVIIVRTATEQNMEWKEIADENGMVHKETYHLKVKNGNLYITGADRRGTIYGIYTFCEWLGVSPWYFFADVPVQRKQKVVLEEGYCRKDWPSVEYRGIFINDEEELNEWVKNYLKEPTIGVKTYERIFELLLRLKGNYIWPAMHVNSFNLTPENGELAHRMGIVVGTSHCDMLMRSNNREWIPWIRKKGYTNACYDYSIEGRNREILKEYWRESAEQNKNYEVCYTLGMRGIHDSGFETRNLKCKTKEEMQSAKTELLKQIIEDQRQILQDTLVHETMMTFIPYKEVLELYDSGLDLPEDITLVWANDNHGYIRRYPSKSEKQRKGGNGIYYHNSYWAPPGMSYVFLCSIPLAHTGNELQKAWNEGIQKLWVLNCGSIKPLEQEITFFLELAWEIGKQNGLTKDVNNFTENWINRTFTGNLGKRTSKLLNDFSQLTNVRKPEHMDYDAFSQTAYGDEASVRIHKYEELFEEGNYLYEMLPREERDAFFQLVLMRIHVAYFTNLAYYYGDRSTLMYERGNMKAAAYYTEKSRESENARRCLLHYYNHEMCNGKWEGILNPEGFPPPRTAMMPVCTPPITVSEKPSMNVHVWNEENDICFTEKKEKWIEIGNRGAGTFKVRLKAPEWVMLSENQTVISTEKRIYINVSDFSKDRKGELLIDNISDGSQQRIPIRIQKQEYEGEPAEDGGLVALEAEWAQSEDFCLVQRLGRMEGNLLEACVEGKPEYGKGNPLCYSFTVCSSGEFLLEIHRFPSLNSVGRLRIGISLDEGMVQIAESFSNDEWRGNWKENVLNNVDRVYVQLPFLEAGKHMLFVWAVDRYFAFSRLVIYTRSRKENNLAGIRGVQRLPKEWNISQWCDRFYGKHNLVPRSVLYAASENEGDSLALTGHIVQEMYLGKKVEPKWYLKKGENVFRETDGAIEIDAAAVLAQTDCAWAVSVQSKGIWKHCAGESFGQSGLAMYIRTPGLSWSAEEAPSLNYRIMCQGGEYAVWMLSKFNLWEESHFSIEIDGKILPKEQLYGEGCLWRYEAEQIYRWVLATHVKLEKGEHVLKICAIASGMRYDRFYLTKGMEEPPADTKWYQDVSKKVLK